MMTLALASANRDESVFPDPDRLDPKRESPARHLAFGFGTHSCLGAALARLEARLALEAVVERFPDFRSPDDPPRWRPTILVRDLRGLRGLRELRLER